MNGQDIIIEQLREKLEKAHAASEYQTRRIEHYRTQLDFCERRAEKAERFIATADSEWKARAEKAERENAEHRSARDSLLRMARELDGIPCGDIDIEAIDRVLGTMSDDDWSIAKASMFRRWCGQIADLRARSEKAERERDEWKARHDTLADVSRKCIATAERERDARLRPETVAVIRVLLGHSEHCDVTPEVLDDWWRCYPEEV